MDFRVPKGSGPVRSEINTKITLDAIEARKAQGIYMNCQCVPYEEIFIYRAWRVLGMQVQRGERRLCTVTGRKGWAHLFCLCQVESMEEN